MTRPKQHDHPHFDSSPQPNTSSGDIWADAARTGSYADVVRILSLQYIQKMATLLASELADTRPYDPAEPFNGGYSDAARASLTAELAKYQAALDWAKA